MSIETNRANAQHSTGPKTEGCKHRSSLNALRHGLTSQIVVMPNEDLQLYQQHVKNFEDEYHPTGATEQQLVQFLADASWRLNRAAVLESNPNPRRRHRPRPPATHPLPSHQPGSPAKSYRHPRHAHPTPNPPVRTHGQPTPRPPKNPPRTRAQGNGGRPRHHRNAQIQRTNLQPNRRWLRFFNRPNHRRLPIPQEKKTGRRSLAPCRITRRNVPPIPPTPAFSHPFDAV